VRDTGEIYKLVENFIFYIPIYFSVDIKIKDVEFFEKYKIFAERTGREIVTSMKNSARPYSFSNVES
jgi:hypothetical protein